MLAARAKRAVVSWLAILAIPMASLAPAILQAAGSSGATNLTEICTSTGARLAPGDGDGVGRGDGPGGSHRLDHCPYCSLHGDAAGMPPRTLPAFAVAVLPAGIPAAFPHAEWTSDAWAGAQSRAPPVPG